MEEESSKTKEGLKRTVNEGKGWMKDLMKGQAPSILKTANFLFALQV